METALLLPIKVKNALTENDHHIMATVTTTHIFILSSHKAQNPLTATNYHKPTKLPVHAY
jgi:hypothetical protein